MSLAAKLRRAPGRIVTGAFILNSASAKFSGDEATAKALHGMAAGAYPVLAKVPPQTFLRALAIGETTLGSALLLPIVPAKVAGAGLMSFSAGLLGMWWRTEGMHEGGRPTQQGLTIAKDVWMFGIGTGLLVDGVVGDAGDSHAVRKANREAAKLARQVDRDERKAVRAAKRKQLRAQAKANAKAQAKAARAAAKQASAEGVSAARSAGAKAAGEASRRQAKATRVLAGKAEQLSRSVTGSGASLAGSAMAAGHDAADTAADFGRSVADTAMSAGRSAAHSAKSAASSAADKVK